MADKSNRLIRDALCRAAAEPSGCALVANKAEPGLFPSSALAKAAAERAKSDGYLQVVRTEAKGKLAREICVLTDKGRQFLIWQSNPREVLEDLVRVLESRQTDASALTESARTMHESLIGLRSIIEQVLPRLTEQPSTAFNGNGHPGAYMNGSATLLAKAPQSTIATDALIADVKAKLAEWHAAAGASEDCPLPELYRRLDSTGAVSIGQFHDGLRQLHDDQMIYLHPWTGPLYALPEPAYALLVGHEIAYYASIR